MQARYTPQEMLALLASCGFAVLEVWDTAVFHRAQLQKSGPPHGRAGRRAVPARRAGVNPLNPDSQTGRARTRRRR